MNREESIQQAADEASWCIANKNRISYAQTRPMEGIGRRRRLPLTVDCSAFVTVCYNWSGAPDPNGLGYNRLGYTGTILSHGTQIPRAAIRVGDLVVFGRGSGNHVCLVLSTGQNPTLASHGSDAGPIRIDFRAELAAQKSYHHGDDTVRWIRVPPRRLIGTRPAMRAEPVAGNLSLATNRPSE
jgi:hypothetical protein